jgi:hypothetical protein
LSPSSATALANAWVISMDLLETHPVPWQMNTVRVSLLLDFASVT